MAYKFNPFTGTLDEKISLATEVSGNIALNGGYISNDGDDEGISIDNDGDVIINGDETRLYLGDAGGEFLYSDLMKLKIVSGSPVEFTPIAGSTIAVIGNNSGGELMLYGGLKTDGSVQDYCKLNCTTDGLTTLSTVDLAGEDADIILAPDGGCIIRRDAALITDGTYIGLDIDFNKTGASTGDNIMYGLKIKADNEDATDGNNTMYGINCTATLTHDNDAGTTTVYGGAFNAQGHDNGVTSLACGLLAIAVAADVNVGLQVYSAGGTTNDGIRLWGSPLGADNCTINTIADGATTIATLDADGGDAGHLTLAPDGSIILDPANRTKIISDPPPLNTGAGFLVDTDITTDVYGNYNAMEIDFTRSGSPGNGGFFTGLLIDCNDPTAISGANIWTGAKIDMDCSFPSDPGGFHLFQVHGLDIDCTTTEDGATSTRGLKVTASGGELNTGVIIECDDGGNDLEIQSSAANLDFLKIKVGGSGVSRIITQDTTTTNGADLSLEVDGDIVLDSATGVIVAKDDGGTYNPTQSNELVTKEYADREHYHIIRAGFYNATTDKVYIPIGSEDWREISSPTGASEKIVFTCPFDGIIVKAIARSESAPLNSDFNFHRYTGTLEIPSSTPTESLTKNMFAGNTNYTFDFNGAIGGDITFSSGDIIMFSFEPSVAPNDIHFTIVLKFDVST